MVEGPREKLMYVVSIHTDPDKADVLSTVDVDPKSSTYCQVSLFTPVGYLSTKVTLNLQNNSPEFELLITEEFRGKSEILS